MLPVLATAFSLGTVIPRLLLWLAGATLLWMGGRFLAKIPKATFWRSLLTYFLAWVAAIAAFLVVMSVTLQLRPDWGAAEVLRRVVGLLASLLVTWFIIKAMFSTSIRKAILAWLPTLAILLVAIPLRMTILLVVFSDLDAVGRRELSNMAISASGKEEFVYHVEKTGPDDIYFSTVSEYNKVSERELRLKGMGKCMAVTNDGTVLALAICPMAGPNPWGAFYLSYPYEVVFIDTGTFQEMHRWKVRPKAMPPPDKDGYTEEIHGFREMALSHDGKTLATVYTKPTTANGAEGQVVTLWEVDSGKDIMELRPPAPDKPLDKPSVYPEINSVGFSADGRLLFVWGQWTDLSDVSMSDSLLSKPVFKTYGFIQIWNITDETEEHFQTNGYYISGNLCSDDSCRYLACWAWQESEGWLVQVWSVPDGNLVISKKITEQVLGIIWDKQAKSFAVRLADQTVVHIKP